MKRANNVTELRPEPPLTVGLVGKQLRENGYNPVSALMPHGLTFPGHPTFTGPAPEYLLSEHPPAVSCKGPAGKYSTADLAVLVVDPSDDSTLYARIRAVLEAAGLTAGPKRLGSDGRELYPLALNSGPFQAQSACGVSFESQRRAGPGASWFPEIIPLDGRWLHGDLLMVPRDDLPVLTAETMGAVLAEIQSLPGRIREENEPPPAPTMAGWIGKSA